MFEGTLIESHGLVGTGTKRWTTLGSMAFQFGVAGLLIAIPMVHPDILPVRLEPPQLVAPVPLKPPPVVRVEAVEHASSGPAMNVPMSAAVPALHSPLLLGRAIADPGPEPMLGPALPMGQGGPSGLLAGIGPGGPGPNVSGVRPKAPERLNVSQGVSAGMLLRPIVPVYPAIARTAGIQGTVVMEAVISKAGRIESLHAVSGPQMLRSAALDAVQAARYQPYRLNGEATEVETTITVNFLLGR